MPITAIDVPQSDGSDAFMARVTERCRASPDAVFDVLADLRSHITWGGTMQPALSQRLLMIDAPAGPATVGTIFQSVGHTSGGQWMDRSVVTHMERPREFAFKTHGQLKSIDNQFVDGHWTHRFEIERAGQGSLITYTCKQPPLSVAPALLNDRRKIVLLYGVILPATLERGVQNLARFAEQNGL